MNFRPFDLHSDPIYLEETVDPNILELNDKAVKAEAPIHVSATAMKDADEETIIIMGVLKTEFKIECGRCLDWLTWPIEVTDFTVELKKPFTPVVDLTPFIREDILLHLPFNAACKLEKGFRCPLSGKTYPPAKTNPASIAGKEVWQELDKLKIKE